MCSDCARIYNDGGENGDGEWELDGDGDEILCRWCGDGGELMLCDAPAGQGGARAGARCPKGFCTECVEKALGGAAELKRIQGQESWTCFACDPAPLQRLLSYKVTSVFL